MAKPKRSIETIVSAIKRHLEDEKASGSSLCLAMWSEADADAGYLVHVDGRMVGVGEYQYGFTHVDEFLGDQPDEETERWARGEAGRVSGSIEALDEEGIEFLSENFAQFFGADHDVVEAAINKGAYTIEELFELAASVPGCISVEGRADTMLYDVAEDIQAIRLIEKGGRLEWESYVAFKKGEAASGDSLGGDIYLQKGDRLVPVRPDHLINPRPMKPQRSHCTP